MNELLGDQPTGIPGDNGGRGTEMFRGRRQHERADILGRHKRLDPDQAEAAMAAHFDDAIGALLT